MKTLPALIIEGQIDLRGCEYHESQQLTHIDGFLVYYHNHGRLTLRRDLTDEEKFQGVECLLSQLDPPVVGQPQIYFWTKAELHETQVADRPAAQFPSSDVVVGQQSIPSFVTAGADFFNLIATNEEHKKLIPLLRVPRTFLPVAVRAVIDQPQPRGRSAEAAPIFVEEPIATDGYAYLSLFAPSNAPWSIAAQITPPVRGHVHMIFGSHSFHGSLAADGTAVLHEIDPELLLAAEGPDLELWVEPESGTNNE